MLAAATAGRRLRSRPRGSRSRWEPRCAWAVTCPPARADDVAATLSTDDLPEVTRGPGPLVARVGPPARGAAQVGVRARRRTGGRWSRPWSTATTRASTRPWRTTSVRPGLTHLLAVSAPTSPSWSASRSWSPGGCGCAVAGSTSSGAAGIAGFVLVARAEPSVLRAAVMGSVALVGMGANGRDRGTRALGVATVLLLLLDPGLASAIGLRPLGPRDRRHPAARARLARRPRPVAPAVAGRGGGRPGRRPAGVHTADRGDLGAGEPRRGAGQPARRTRGRAGDRAGPRSAAC